MKHVNGIAIRSENAGFGLKQTLAALTMTGVMIGALLNTAPAQAQRYRVALLNQGLVSHAEGASRGWEAGSSKGWVEEAALWIGDGAGGFINLNPNLSTTSRAVAIDGAIGLSPGRQVGYGSGPATGGSTHAFFWQGTRASLKDLHTLLPAGFAYSYANGIRGSQQVGWGAGAATGWNNHALLWNALANTAVDLHPGGFTYSEAHGVDHGWQVGYGAGPATGGKDHALAWNGSSSVADFHPAGWNWSRALALSSNQMVGYGNPSAMNPNNHAILWDLSGIIDLTPAGFTWSEAYNVSNRRQAGWGFGPATGGWVHALAWQSSAASAVDLHRLLPAGFAWSYAHGIDEFGNVVGTAVEAATGRGQAVVWQREPELASLRVTPTHLTNGQQARGRITLDAPALRGGVTVFLTRSNATVVGIPVSVTVPFGSTSAEFPVNGFAPVHGGRSTITATLVGVRKSVTVTVVP